MDSRYRRANLPHQRIFLPDTDIRVYYSNRFSLVSIRSENLAIVNDGSRTLFAAEHVDIIVQADHQHAMQCAWHWWCRFPLPVLIAGGAYNDIAPPANLEAINRRIEQSKTQFSLGGTTFTTTTHWRINILPNFYRTTLMTDEDQ